MLTMFNSCMEAVGKIVAQNMTNVTYTIIFKDACNQSIQYLYVNSTEYMHYVL